MTDKHTPGPWKFALFEHEPNEAFVQWSAGYAAIHGSRAGREANARLIAAAPELLDCLRALLDEHPGTENVRTFNARAAIAKATGC